MRQHGINPNDPIEELLRTTRKKLMLRESSYKKLKMMKRKKRYTFARVVRLAILEGIRKFQKENLFLNLQMQDFGIAISILEQKTKRDRKKGKNAEFKTTQAEIPNIFSVWDECFSSARNYIKTLK